MEERLLGDRLELGTLVEAVLARNPSIEAARRAWQAAAQMPARERGLGDLMVSYSLAPSSIGSSVVRFGHEIEVAQELPFHGKRGLRASVAEGDAEAVRGDLETLKLELARQAGLLHAEWTLVHEALRINDEHAELLRDLIEAATERYIAGLASQQDPLSAEAALAHVVHAQAVLDAERAILRARINSLLHRELDAEVPPPDGAAGGGAGDDAPAAGGAAPLHRHQVIGGGAEVETALASRPELRALDASARARQAELDLAGLASRPDFAVMASYSSMWAESEHRVMLGGSVRLPVWRSRVRAGVAVAEERLRQVESARMAAEDAIREEVRVAMERLHEARHVLELFRSRLLPVAHDRVEAALAGFRSGRNDFPAVLDAERDQRDLELDYHRAVADLARRRIDLDRALGQPVGEPEERASTNDGDQP